MKKLFVIILLFTVNFAVLAQSLSDIQNVKVDNLSDAQIEQLIKRAEASGMNEQQLIAMARERGMPSSEISKFQRRVNSLRNKGIDAANFGGADAGREGITEEVTVHEEGAKLNEQQSKIFGFSLFRNNKMTFTPNLNIPTPMNYMLGTGDQLLIDVYGASQQQYDQRINNEGMIFIPNIGPINLAGLTVEAATARLRATLSNIYSGLSGSNPNTFLQVRVGNIRSIQVAMVGEVFAPGNYTLSSFATVFNALYASGGVTENGSLRAIKVYRNNRLLAEVDVYNFLVNADQSTNVRLQDNDVIMVPPVQKRVEIQGPVRRPGLFEMVQDETLQDLLNFAGGFTSMAYPSRAIVYRTTEKELKVENIEEDAFASFRPRQGDNFIFGEILTRYENRVQITGALMRPGTFALQEGMGINELIRKAEGLREDAFLNRATLYRTRADFSLEIVALNIGAIVRGEEQDVQLEREDVLNIPSIYDLKEEYYVRISGEVNRPGAFAFGENMSVSDLVLKAGGFKESATASQLEIARRVKNDISGKLAEIIRIDIDKDLKINADGKDQILKPFDHVIIRRSPGFQRQKLVSVEGEVFYPGDYALSNANERISDLLQRAGGLNQFAYAKGATLIRRNEFFDTPSENEMKAQSLTEVKRNATANQQDNTEAEKIMLARIDSKINERGGDQANKRGGLQADDFRKETIEEISESETMKNSPIRTTEMVGIDLLAIINNPGSNNDLILQEGDVLSVPKELQTVRIRGEVLYPNTARYRELSSFKSYISRAGGFTEKSRRGRSYVVYANGDVQRTRKFLFINNYPAVEPGAEIIVPAKPEKDPLSAQAWIGIASSLATLALLINNLTR
ncbi:SLBB domain-containing protein [Mongoliitalea daihaiensis]|uniref:SLBB domain-containing protein n=1 Tax=Mongoliitalea daihaiensis TaxID=2782006 RepID=UPI001F22ADA8|nr:SLBB domain-containing protein [Mongoliitalea daihaiensis]UJP63376.1 SLBB domain-containing protein [Mongoliitalea daihaiensis]